MISETIVLPPTNSDSALLYGAARDASRNIGLESFFGATPGLMTGTFGRVAPRVCDQLLTVWQVFAT